MDQQVQASRYWLTWKISIIFLIISFLFLVLFWAKIISISVFGIGFAASYLLSESTRLFASTTGGLWRPSLIWKAATHFFIFSPLLFLVLGAFLNFGFFVLIVPCFILAKVGVYHPMPDEGLFFSYVNFVDKSWKNLYRTKAGSAILIFAAFLSLAIGFLVLY